MECNKSYPSLSDVLLTSTSPKGRINSSMSIRLGFVSSSELTITRRRLPQVIKQKLAIQGPDSLLFFHAVEVYIFSACCLYQ